MRISERTSSLIVAAALATLPACMAAQAVRPSSAPKPTGVAPTLRIDAGIKREILTARPRPGFVYTDDPLVETTSTVHAGALSLHEQARVRELVDRLDHLPVPTLAIHGADDRLVPPTASARLERLPEVTRIVYPGLRHETHNEATSTTAADIVRWLDQQVAVLESLHN